MNRPMMKPLQRALLVCAIGLLTAACGGDADPAPGAGPDTNPGPPSGPIVGAPQPLAATCTGADLSALQTIVYVSPEGSDSPGCGKETTSSCASVQQGIDSCSASGCGVLVRHGFYKAAATTRLRSGVGVYGGCTFDENANHRYRSVLSATPAPGMPAVLADGLTASTAFHGIVVLAADAPPGHASIAMAIHASDGMSLTRTVLVSGKGGDGAPGASPGQAVQGQEGGWASIGIFAPGGQGAGGLSCQGQSTGGRGGDGAAWQQNALSGCFLWCACNSSGGAWGSVGGSAGQVAGGANGGPGSNAYGCVGLTGTAGQGGSGAPGSSGECNATGGAANGDLWGTPEWTGWSPNAGGTGQTGDVGSGGGGGGAGGLCAGTTDGFHWVPSWGQPGGGGGGGGCGGTGGSGGQQGGASIALFLRDSGANWDSGQNSFVSGTGGDGGAGGNGGIGGPGGGSGPGGNYQACNYYDTNRGIGWGGLGGNGGPGGQGGAGSGGAGGNGGPGIGLALVGITPSPSDGTTIYPGRSGAGGSKGAGGSNDANACRGGAGEDGLAGGAATWHRF